MIVFAQPTRGITFTRSIESVLREAKGQPVLLTHDLPVPDSFNDLRARALSYSPDYVLFVDEDIVLRKGVVERLLDLDADIALADYYLKPGQTVVRYDEMEQVLFGGMGCFLIRADALEDIGEFRTDTVYHLPDYTPHTVIGMGYGRQDVDYCMRARQRGYHIEALDETLEHLRVKQWGDHTNDGCHTIIDKGEA